MVCKGVYFWYPILFLICISAPAQFRDQKFYHLTRNNGLSQSTVHCIVKDTSGYMWFGTNDGLNRYDGYAFTHYQYNTASKKSIGLGRVRALFVDKKGRLWAGTDQGGLYLFREQYNNFIRYPRYLDKDSKGKYNDILDIHEASDGRLWIATFGDGLILLNPENDSVTVFSSPGTENVSTVELYNDKLFIGTETGVYFLPLNKHGYIESAQLQPVPELAGLQVFRLYASRNGILWVGTYGNGAYAYDAATGKTTEYSTRQQGFRKLNHDIVRDFIEFGSSNTLIIGTGGGGLNIVDFAHNKTEYSRSRLNDQFSLNSDIIYTIYQDNIENIWIGTYNGGVNILFKSKDKFRHIKSFGGANELSNNSVLSIIEAGNGKLWIGTDGGGLELYDRQTNSFRHFRNEPGNSNSLCGNVVKSLYLDKHDKLWIGTFNAGLSVYDVKNKKFTNYRHNSSNPNSLSQDHIWGITEDKEGNIWLATLGGGLDLYDRAQDGFIHYRNNPALAASLSDNTLSCILCDSQGVLWIGTESGGVNVLVDKDKGIFKRYNRTLNKDLISSDQISVIFEDSKNNIWVGTVGGGLNLYRREEDRFICYTKDDGLADNLICGILEDDHGNLWISTNNGISEFINGTKIPREVCFRNFSVGDGLQSNEFTPQSFCRTSDGILYFGGINGMNYFDPSNIISNNHIPPVVITDLKILNRSVLPGDPDSPLQHTISKTYEVKVSYKESIITFEFAALDFTLPSKNQYKYMLEGFDTKWNEVGNQRSATYTNLNPGKYLFRVIASNNDGIWNTAGTSLRLIITPPFWKTWWFRASLIILVIILVISGYRIKIQSLENHRKNLKKQVDERTRELLDLNHLLEKQNMEIQAHREELLSQKEHLIIINKELEHQQEKIQEQNIELEKHRHNLEEIVEQRTAELEKAKQKAEESDRLKSSFLSNMSHEIRTPLNAIVGFSSLLAEEDTTAEEREEYIRHINTNSDTLLVLIDDILDLSKIESNQLKVSISEIDINEFIDGLYTTFLYRKKPEITFKLKNTLRERNIIFSSDKVRLNQVLTNLLDNAFKFTDNGVIELGITADNKQLTFFVEDTGIGIPAQAQNKIFERFYKSDANTERLYRGSGLGLTITKKLVKILGGTIHVTSEEGKGSRFDVVFPLKD